MRFDLLDPGGILSPELRGCFAARSARRSYPRRTYLLREGERCTGVHFVVAGIVGAYELAGDREVFRAFYRAGDPAADTKSLSTDSPSTSHLLAIEPTETVFVLKRDLLDLYGVDPAFETFGRSVLQRLLVDRTDDTRRLLTLRPAARYAALVEADSDLVQRVPLQYLASYLGMTRETLSRIRGRAARRG